MTLVKFIFSESMVERVGRAYLVRLEGVAYYRDRGIVKGGTIAGEFLL